MPPISDHPSTDRADTSPEAQLARILANVPPILRLPKAGTRCPYTQLSRTGLSELVTPTRRNGGKPPVQARYQRAHRYAVRGVWLIPAEPLFRYLLGPGIQPAGFEQEASHLGMGCGDEHPLNSNAVRSVMAAPSVHLAENCAFSDGQHEVARPLVQQSRASGRPAPGLSFHLSLNPHMIFVPRASFGDRPINGRLMKTVVSDDESLPSYSFIEVAEDEWTENIGSGQRATPGELF